MTRGRSRSGGEPAVHDLGDTPSSPRAAETSSALSLSLSLGLFSCPADVAYGNNWVDLRFRGSTWSAPGFILGHQAADLGIRKGHTWNAWGALAPVRFDRSDLRRSDPESARRNPGNWYGWTASVLQP
jgi:hypothetical protein